MDPLTLALIAGGTQVVGGLIGNELSRGDRERAAGLSERMLREYENLTVPEKEALQLQLARYYSVGELDPRLEQLYTLGPSQAQTVTADPRLIQQQMANLQEMQSIVEAGGYDPAVKADLAAALKQQEQSIRANQEALRMQAEARGMQAAGATQALQAMAAQSEANRTAELQSKLAAEAYRNRLAALSGASAEAGRLRSTDVEEQMARARAADEIARFNIGAMQGREQRNVAAQREVEAANLAMRQRIAEANVGLTQKEEEARRQAEIDRFNMQTARLAGMSGATSTAAQAAAGQAQATQQMVSGIASGGSEALLSYLQAQKAKPTDDTTNKTENTPTLYQNVHNTKRLPPVP
jgi:Tfp pilus assembly protein PilP